YQLANPNQVIQMMRKFGTAINCMDGRVQIPVIEWLKNKYSVDFVDMITEPGPVKLLSDDREKIKIQSIKDRVEISVKKHDSKIIAIIAHHDCAGNPVGKEIQLQQMESAIKKIRTWDLGVEIVGLWVDDRWQVNEL
ncbi:MAG: hypothetical protein N3D12_06650, partial [Candidatus Methanomethyliaceae archaeon]|nr:hypothetical protein [Candidatus Methanomethyliaceae archaeon]